MNGLNSERGENKKPKKKRRKMQKNQGFHLLEK